MVSAALKLFPVIMDFGGPLTGDCMVGDTLVIGQGEELLCFYMIIINTLGSIVYNCCEVYPVFPLIHWNLVVQKPRPNHLYSHTSRHLCVCTAQSAGARSWLTARRSLWAR